MHAVVISVAINDYEPAKAALLEQVVPQVKQAPGFVAGYWVSVKREQGRGIVAFESEEAAQNAANALGGMEPVGVTIESVEVGEVDASA
jgi:hypothetical protein